MKTHERAANLALLGMFCVLSEKLLACMLEGNFKLKNADKLKYSLIMKNEKAV